jgi:predicted transcriptional regulator
MSKVISIRISDTINKRLNEISEETERKKSFHIQKALET